MSGVQQAVFQNQRSFVVNPESWPGNIGIAYAGGYFAGQINDGGTVYNLVVSPKASGFSTGLAWGPVSNVSGTASELEVLYYYLKPTTTSNTTSPPNNGANPNAVAPEPVNTGYTASAPEQTSAATFKTGQSEAFGTDRAWTSTQSSVYPAYRADSQYFSNGGQDDGYKPNAGGYVTRAIRKVAV